VRPPNHVYRSSELFATTGVYNYICALAAVAGFTTYGLLDGEAELREAPAGTAGLQREFLDGPWDLETRNRELLIKREGRQPV
jgi:hypothetical protein